MFSEIVRELSSIRLIFLPSWCDGLYSVFPVPPLSRPPRVENALALSLTQFLHYGVVKVLLPACLFFNLPQAAPFYRAFLLYNRPFPLSSYFLLFLSTFFLTSVIFSILHRDSDNNLTNCICFVNCFFDIFDEFYEAAAN